MTAKTPKNSRILEAVYETARDLHACGLLDEEQMRQYKTLCLEPITLYLERDIVEYLQQKCDSDPEKLQVLINELLRKDIEIAQRVTVAVSVGNERNPVGWTTGLSLPTTPDRQRRAKKPKDVLPSLPG
jgi:putative transcriptional regulator